jgi:2-haloacid dehalogenase
MSNSKLAIIFDLGGVLIDWNPRHLYRKLFDDDAAMETFLSEVCTPHWNEQQDAGRPFADAVELLVAEHPQYETHIRAYWDRWH